MFHQSIKQKKRVLLLFKASTGWLDKFKNRRGIRKLNIQGEKLSAAEETLEPAKNDRGKRPDTGTNLQRRRNWSVVECLP